jgi:hypothetical protein
MFHSCAVGGQAWQLMLQDNCHASTADGRTRTAMLFQRAGSTLPASRAAPLAGDVNGALRALSCACPMSSKHAGVMHACALSQH